MNFAQPFGERSEFDKLVIRTHFDDENAWQEVVVAMDEPWDDGEADSTSHVVDDRAWAGATVDQVKAAVREQEPDLHVVFIADEVTMQADHHALLAVNMDDEPNYLDKEYDVEHGTTFGRQFRIAPNEASGLDCNLMLGNMDYEDWAETAARSADGVFHCWP
ncbi:hypothetical protein GCM10018793_01380 [Streptomyces sulfonofaciens]|uniref:DUF6924 domain-containing protein n=1 Tax=Streptomyces sulfonofaciens TaxID=68272 RepID=A0A919KQC8_9ACTN|nr:hypothetical protein [Streptomyces sulfonofaciens]GHH69235.1 hypothetical protein GCM10018793_01380 [Streptomyces sulfonofaciens]